MEIWKDIKDYEGLYAISNLGRVKNLKYNRLIFGNIDFAGYRVFGLYKNGVQTKKKLHRLMAITFLNNPNNYEQINHINGNKDDNRLTNLEWCDHTHNMKHAYQIGLNSPQFGELSGRSKLKEGDVSNIRNDYENGINSPTLLGLKYNISEAQIRRIVKRENWKHV
jgi:hypothetical protein